MKSKYWVLIVLIIGIIAIPIETNSLTSVFALPDVKITRPSICELHPRVCTVAPIPNLPDNVNLTFPVDWHWNPVFNALRCNGLTQCDHSVILIPFDGNALAITVPTKDIEIVSNVSSPNQ